MIRRVLQFQKLGDVGLFLAFDEWAESPRTKRGLLPTPRHKRQNYFFQSKTGLPLLKAYFANRVDLADFSTLPVAKGRTPDTHHLLSDTECHRSSLSEDVIYQRKHDLGRQRKFPRKPTLRCSLVSSSNARDMRRRFVRPGEPCVIRPIRGRDNFVPALQKASLHFSSGNIGIPE
jgi:hypothetical protein